MKRFLFLPLVLLPFLLPSTSFAQLEGLVIVIDPGHGGYGSNDRHLVPDPGIDFYESESNFYKAHHLKGMLEAHGATVHLTRTTNDETTTYVDHASGDPYEPSLTARWSLANSVNADWFHSIHSNAFNASINYTIVLLKEDISTRQPAFPEAVIMSSNVYNQIRAHIRTSSSGGNIDGYPGVYKDYTFYGGTNGGYNLGVLSGLTMPGELSEGSFHDFFPETRRLMNNDYRKMEAYGLMKAFLEYFGAPADTLGIIAGIQKNPETLLPLNGTVVRLLPENRTYAGDAFNNGFYMFDSLTAGPHTIIFDTPGFINDSVEVMVTTGGIHFVDRTLAYWYPAVIQTSPANGDTSRAVDAPVSVRFSLAMDTASVRQALSVSPSANSSLSWTADLKQLTMTFNPPLEYYTPYTVTIDSAAKALNGYGVDINGDEIGGDTLLISFRTESPLQPAAPVSFGQVKKDDTTGVMLTLRNRASANIVLQSISNSTPVFWTTATLPDTIAAADSTSIEVFFSPVSFGSFSDVLVLSSDSGTIAVSVTGSSPAFSLLVSHTFLGFGTVTTDTSKVRPFYLTTSSINGVRVDSIYTKTASFSYSPQPSFPQNLTPADTIFLTITFAPQGIGSTTDSLVILSNAASVTRVVLTGNGIINSAEKIGETVDRFALMQNYPNPFNPTTAVSYQLAAVSDVRLSVFDVLGREVAVLVNEEQAAGVYRVSWDASTVPSGIYFYTLTTPHYRASRKMVLIK